jgi:hypothetical protein
MAKYRQKPVVIEAEQWFPGKVVDGVVTEYDPEIDGVGGKPPFPFIRTLEGKMFVSPGDWIITGVNSEKYPCKPDIFEKTYEPVEGE